jgi:hypothetical protein
MTEPLQQPSPKWAIPGDQKPVYLLRFDDAEGKEQLWSTLEEGLEAWRKYAPAWNCWLFGPVDLAAVAEPSSHPAESLRKPFYGNSECAECNARLGNECVWVDNNDISKVAVCVACASKMAPAKSPEVAEDIRLRRNLDEARDAFNAWNREHGMPEVKVISLANAKVAWMVQELSPHGWWNCGGDWSEQKARSFYEKITTRHPANTFRIVKTISCLEVIEERPAPGEGKESK